MKLNIQPTVIFRTPKFSYQSELVDCWEELKLAISISSAAFYETIKEVKASELKDLPPKVYFTIWKYFNRAKFRSTPYGTFAGFSLLNNAIKPAESRIVIEEAQSVRQLVDWPYKNNIQLPLADLLQKNCLLFSNSSYYLTPNSIRYIACTDGVFELAELDQDDFVQQILAACLKPIRFNDLVKQLELNDAETGNLFGLLQDMHDLQLVFTNYDPNIIGDDYFERLGLPVTAELPKYLIAQRTVLSGNINERSLQAIPGLINTLHAIMPAKDRDALSQFSARFKKKFEDQEVPLLLALDPEMGIGYDELEQAGQNSEFITRFNNKPPKKAETENIKTALKTFLREQKFEKGKTVYLNKLTLTPNQKLAALPNSFSMVMSVHDDLIFIEQIGGATSNALSGRFTMAADDVAQYAKDIAEAEQQANPEVLFFDVAYMVEANVDNVNRRKLIYGHQLSILNFDTSASPLALNDIQISVRGIEIILRSKHLNKRLVPRMASAYNYIRSDLSVFRLLCDLQHQGLQTNLSFSLDSIFPDLDYYPRLQYQNIILSRSKWKIKKEALLGPGQKLLSIAECRSYLNNLGVSEYFKAGMSDQTLCFALQNDDDINAFLQYVQKHGNTYIEEMLMPQNSIVVDETAKPYLAQFVLSIGHNEQIYRGLAKTPTETGVTRSFLPGKEWLYFEIYCHQQRSDQILTEVIAPFLTTHTDQVKTWFFIRYNENGNHIRFRIQLNNPRDGQLLISELMNELELFLNSGLVSDVQIKTYKRELERYGSNLIEDVEQHFATDSEFVLSLLETQTDDFNKYKLCSLLVSKIIGSGVIDKLAVNKIVRLMSDNFNEEHRLDPADFKQLNIHYQEFRKTEWATLTVEQEQGFSLFSASFIKILKQCAPENALKLLTDLIHMHVNRLFNKDQRTNEMVMYYFLLKDIQRQNATNLAV
ncbi:MULTISPECIES: lantibiotic dehydratase [unclassified Pedobacter]|uniref:lantibiotic dehydratase n=1 Tax=unclassified Pedobacter TaxID=2628915 RepID=UPI00141E0B52|nr:MULTISPECIES: lantibiotic dehydratase [unclassified Pedobacter]NII85758.1 thiopeptide-type bacteriocin biosynthesis protein [Pedobacter sp. SG908]NMN39325.1 thiopeptide-type bacteriocin biosynthesis protein [Pedobacter sp. SG918]